MRVLLSVMILAALTVTACEPKPKTPAEKLGAAIQDAGDAIQDAARPAPKTPGQALDQAVDKAGEKIDRATH